MRTLLIVIICIEFCCIVDSLWNAPNNVAQLRSSLIELIPQVNLQSVDLSKLKDLLHEKLPQLSLQQDFFKETFDKVVDIETTISNDQRVIASFQSITDTVDHIFVDKDAESTLRSIVGNLQTTPIIRMFIQSTSLSQLSLIAGASVVAALLLSPSLLSSNSRLTPYSGTEYNAAEANIYFRTRPLTFLLRLVEILYRSFGFVTGIAFDFVNGKLTDPESENERAAQVTEVLSNLGPTFIKIGQSLSIRTDLLRPAYISALTQLQDQVPPFSTKTAREIIEEDLGMPAGKLFVAGVEEDANVIAAASLGQVFKATLQDGRVVAVKVQRPNILTTVALDMHLLRTAAPIIRQLAGLQSDLEGIVDDWGRGFVNELNYVEEAKNADKFMQMVATTPLNNIVFAPPVVKNLSSRRVLTTEWVDGERLDRSSKDDVAYLCSVAMNTYLTMMLEGEILHCDPHPGNLKRTPDGRLCILDWGLVTTIPPDLQQSFIEHIAHLTSRDYAQVPSDLVKLGFVPPGKEKVILEQGVVDTLASIYGQWAKGGGAAKVDVNAVFSQLQGLVEKYGNVFILPPYFAYIARAFGVLEGIGLSTDPDYAILGECLPYISQRLLADSERTSDALGSFIYGAESGSATRVIDVDRVQLLVSGFNKYTTTTSQQYTLNVTPTTPTIAPAVGSSREYGTGMYSDLQSQPVPPTYSPQLGMSTPITAIQQPSPPVDTLRIVDERADLLLGILLQTRGGRVTPIQQLILEEIAKILGSAVRASFQSLRQFSGTLPTGRSILGTLVDPLGLFSGSQLIEVNDFDERVLGATNELAKLLGTLAPQEEWLRDVNAQDTRLAVRLVANKIWGRRRDIGILGVQLARIMLLQTASRVEASSFSGSANRKVGGGDNVTGAGLSTLVDDGQRLQRAREYLNQMKVEEI